MTVPTIVWSGALLVSLMTGCGGDGPLASNSGPVQVRVQNDRSVTLAVSIGPAAFGAVAPGTITDYQDVFETANHVVVDGQVVDTADFCEGCADFGGGRWTYAFLEDGTAITIDLSLSGLVGSSVQAGMR